MNDRPKRNCARREAWFTLIPTVRDFVSTVAPPGIVLGQDQSVPVDVLQPEIENDIERGLANAHAFKG